MGAVEKRKVGMGRAEVAALHGLSKARNNDGLQENTRDVKFTMGCGGPFLVEVDEGVSLAVRFSSYLCALVLSFFSLKGADCDINRKDK